MNCPACKDIKLVITERQGIEIDYCPECRGVWLDRGELDKIIEKSSLSPNFNFDERRMPPKNFDDDYYKYNYRKKKRGFLDDLFDF
jgi:Zn-finger nucleic acid-binding protein